MVGFLFIIVIRYVHYGTLMRPECGAAATVFLERAQISERPLKSINKRDSKRCCFIDRVAHIHTLHSCSVSDEARMVDNRSSNYDSLN
jgi:hypothetical protein